MVMMMDSICKNALEFFGEETQINKCIEESVELIIALVKFKNEGATEQDILKIIEKHIDIHDIEDWEANVIEELADNKIMNHQMTILFNGHEKVKEMKNFKLQRLNEMIEE